MFVKCKMAGIKSIHAVLRCTKILRQDSPVAQREGPYIFAGFWQCVHDMLIAITTASGIL